MYPYVWKYICVVVNYLNISDNYLWLVVDVYVEMGYLLWLAGG